MTTELLWRLGVGLWWQKSPLGPPYPPPPSAELDLHQYVSL